MISFREIPGFRIADFLCRYFSAVCELNFDCRNNGGHLIGAGLLWSLFLIIIAVLHTAKTFNFGADFARCPLLVLSLFVLTHAVDDGSDFFIRNVRGL